MDGSSVFREYSNGQCSPYLVKAICLVTCKTKQAMPFLRLKEDGPLLEPPKFAYKLLTALDAAIKAELEPDRVTKIQILALMNLNNDGPAGMDRSSNHLSQAICEAWSLSLHFTIHGNTDQEQCDYLWWSLRNLDRLNKPISGAGPFMIDDMDISIDRITVKSESYRSQLMGLALVLGDLITTATKVYKASRTSTVDDCEDFPSLADVTADTGFESFHRWHRAYLELWYHLASMLSCRFSAPGTVPYTRRLTSADAILSIILNRGQDSLPPLPLVPHAMSTATTIIYRAFRDGQRSIDQATRDLRLCCQVLDSLSKRWSITRGIAKLAKRLLKLISQPSSANNGQTQSGNAHSDDRQSSQSRKRGRASISSNTDQQSSAEILAGIPQSGAIPPNSLGMAAAQTPMQAADFSTQMMDGWMAADPSYSQLDRAFYDMFDCGMPNVFREPSSWEYLQVPHDEESCGSSDFQLPSYFASPELEYNYQQPPAGNPQEPG